MTEVPSQRSYAVLGRGRWGATVTRILRDAGRHAQPLTNTPRPQPGESGARYRDRLEKSLTATSADIAWVCLAPTEHTRLVIEAAIRCGLHIIVEKPWMIGESDTQALVEAAQTAGVATAVHYQYCFLSGLEALTEPPADGSEWTFGGEFSISRPNRLGLPASQNLASHVVAIHQRHFCDLAVGAIRTGYESVDSRRVWLTSGEDGSGRRELDFTSNREPIIQRFIAAFEDSISTSRPFPLGFEFAQKVYAQTQRLETEGRIQIVTAAP